MQRDEVIEIVQRGGAVVFAVRVQPRSSRDGIGGAWQGALKVRLTAPPVDDRANAALCRLLAEALGVAVSAVRIVSGEKSRTKRIEVRGVTVEQVQALSNEKLIGRTGKREREQSRQGGAVDWESEKVRAPKSPRVEEFKIRRKEKV